MSGLLLILIIFIVGPWIWRKLSPYLMRWAQRRTEAYVRNAMGMPPRDDSRRQKRAGQQGARGGYYGSRRASRPQSPIIPKEYAVDVDFTEVHSYSSEETIASDGKTTSFVRESQVSDAEIIEIRKDSK